jgi:uncharacterized protein with PQ loop repeat
MFVDVCVSLAPMTSILLCAAPLPTIWMIQSERSVGNFPLLPYSCMTASSLLWTTYGVLKHEWALIVPNAVGFALALYYMKAFLVHAPKQSPTLPGSVRQHLTVVSTVIAATVFTAALHVFPTDWYGKVGVALCIALFASPLAALRIVIAEQSANSIPLPFTIASVVNCLFWTVGGIWKWHDVNVWIPNALGLFFGLVQVFLKVLYHPGGGMNLCVRYYSAKKDELTDPLV